MEAEDMLTIDVPAAFEVLGERVRRRREELGWSQSEFARRSGVSQPRISQLESGTGKRPTVETLNRLARTLGVAVADLTQWDDCPPSEADLPADLRADIAALPLDLRGLVQQLIEKGRQLPDTPEGRAAFEMGIEVAIAYYKSVASEQQEST